MKKSRSLIIKIKNLLLKNTTQKQIILKNTFWLGASEVLVRLIKFFLIVYIVRVLGSTDYGRFSFAISFVALLGIFFDFGLSPIVTREFVKNAREEKNFPPVIGLKLFLSAATAILIGGMSFFITNDPVVRYTIFVIILYSLVTELNGLYFAFLRARQKMEYEAWFRIVQSIALTSLALLIMAFLPSIVGLSLAYLSSGIISLIMVLLLSQKIFPITVSFNGAVWKKYFLMAWPLALAAGLATIYNSIDSVMMGYWGQLTQAGYYNAAYKIINLVLIPGALIAQGFYPALSSEVKNERSSRQKTWNLKTQIMIALALPLLVGGVILAKPILGFLYGSEFMSGTLSFQILLVSVAVIYLHTPLSYALLVFNKQKSLFKITLIGAIINIVLNIVLIPTYSLDGAAASTTITHAFIFLLLLIIVPRIAPIKLVNLPIIKMFVAATVASLIMGAVILYLAWGVIWSILVGIAVYAVVLTIFALSLLRGLKNNYA